MKILCTKKEFAKLVRICAKNSDEFSCKGCSFYEICAENPNNPFDPENFHNFCQIVADGEAANAEPNY